VDSVAIAAVVSQAMGFFGKVLCTHTLFGWDDLACWRLCELTSKLIVRVVKIGCNYCSHKVGDFFEVENDVIQIPEGKHVCIWSMSSLLPFLSARQRSKEESKDWLFRVEYIHCPDPDGKAVWRIETVS
jgi:uncharacterized repeat protein (TIGR04076 family)